MDNGDLDETKVARTISLQIQWDCNESRFESMVVQDERDPPKGYACAVLLLPACCPRPNCIEPLDGEPIGRDDERQAFQEDVPCRLHRPRPHEKTASKTRRIDSKNALRNKVMFERRRALGLSLKRLAHLVGTTERHLSEIERDLRPPNREEFTEIAALLNCTPDELWPNWRERFQIEPRIKEIPFSRLSRAWARRIDALMSWLEWEREQREFWRRSLRAEFYLISDDLQARPRAVLEYLLDVGPDDRSGALAELAREVGISRSHIGVIKAKLITRLRHPAWSRRFRDFWVWDDIL